LETDSLQSDPLADLLGDPNIPNPSSDAISETDFADFLALTANRIRTLTRDEVLKRTGKANYDRREAVRAYCHDLLEALTKKGHASKGGEAMEAEKLRLATALAQKAERAKSSCISEVNLTAAKFKSREHGGSAFPPGARSIKKGPKASNPHQLSSKEKEDVIPQKVRYYLHGDQKEDDPELWLCSRCDAFVREVHFFEGLHQKEKLSDHERHTYERKRFPNILKNSPGKWRRPTNPPNCLA
jgi:hypothetical protein